MRALLLTCCLALPVHAQSTCSTDAMIVLDGSASMAEIGYEGFRATRIQDARAALSLTLPLVEPVRRMGLLTYGPGGADSCSGISLRLGPTPMAAARIVAEAEALSPAGRTPLAASVEAAAEALSYRTNPAIVVLVSDGNESCGGRPCTLADRLEAEGADLTVHVIGYKTVTDTFAWENPERDLVEGDAVARCLADRTGGVYVTAETLPELAAALQETLECIVVGRGPSARRLS